MHYGIKWVDGDSGFHELTSAIPLPEHRGQSRLRDDGLDSGPKSRGGLSFALGFGPVPAVHQQNFSECHVGRPEAGVQSDGCLRCLPRFRPQPRHRQVPSRRRADARGRA
jgi:hypothetical protein